MNGGQVAINGFRLQVLWALLESLIQDDWCALTIEPSDEDGALSKVDIRWELPATERHDQVKSTTRVFNQSDVRRWATELATTSNANEKRLVLIGVPTAGVTPGCIVEDVEVVVRTRDEAVLNGAAAYRTESYCRSVGIRPAYDHTPKLLELLIGLLLGRASIGHRWTRATLVNELGRMTQVLRENNPSPPVVSYAERADRVQAAMRMHSMRRAKEREQVGSLEWVYRFCEWPPPSFADPDGYFEVSVLTVSGPGDCEATGCNYIDRICTSSPRIELFYTWGSQGAFEHLRAILAKQDDVLFSNGDPFELMERRNISFYPERGEILIMHNGKSTLSGVRCIE